MHLLATDPDHIVRLPWHLPIDQWEGDWVLDVPRGLSRHVVRFVRAGPGGTHRTRPRRPTRRWPTGSTACCATSCRRAARRSRRRW